MNVRYIFLYWFIFMMITASEHLIPQRKRAIYYPKHVIPFSWYWYQALIPYNQFSHFKFVKIQEILCFHLILFTPNKIHQLFLLLYFHEICFCNCFKATSEKSFAIILIRLSYPTCYWNIIDRYSHNYTLLSLVFNDTIIHLYCPYQKTLEWDIKKLIFEKLSKYTSANL